MKRLFTLAFVAALSVTSLAWAQPGGRGGAGFFGGRGGGGLLALAQNAAVQKEIEAVEDQVAAITKLAEEGRAARGEGQRIDFRNMTDEQRAELRARREKETTAANAKLAEILLPHQIKRLKEIRIQQLGTAAVSDPEVAAALKLTDKQKADLEAAATADREAMQQAFQRGGGGQGQNQDQARARFQELRTKAEQRVLDVLTADQKAELDKLKGAAFEMPRFERGDRPAGDRGGQRGQRGPRRGGN